MKKRSERILLNPFAVPPKWMYPKKIRQGRRILSIIKEDYGFRAIIRNMGITTGSFRFTEGQPDCNEFAIRQRLNFIEGCEVFERFRGVWLRESDFPQWAYYWARNEAPTK